MVNQRRGDRIKMKNKSQYEVFTVNFFRNIINEERQEMKERNSLSMINFSGEF